MSVKIKVSYESHQELERVLQVLSPIIKTYKVAKRQEKQFKNAYISVNEAVSEARETPIQTNKYLQ